MIAGQLSPLRQFFAKRLLRGIHLMSYWKLEESTGARVDSHGANNLTVVNSPGNAAGKIGNAINLVATASQYLTLTSNASVQSGPASFNVACWVKLTDLSGIYPIVTKDDAGSNREYYSRYLNSINRFQFYTVSGGVHTGLSADTFGAPTAGVWYFLEFGRDHSNLVSFISVNGGPRDVVSSTVNPTAGTAPFLVGRHDVGPLHMNGVIDEVYFRKGSILTPYQVSLLYNGGAGLAYPFI